jgi:signal transduction histidine kinase
MSAPLEATLDALAERLDEPVARLDAHHRVAFANAAFVRVFGPAPGAFAQLAPDDAIKASLIEALSAANEAMLPLLDSRGRLVLASIDSLPCGEGRVVVLHPRRAVPEAAGDALAQASHALRGPLSTILGFAQMIAGGVGSAADPKLRGHAEAIEQAARTMSGVVDDLARAASDDDAAERLLDAARTKSA